MRSRCATALLTAALAACGHDGDSGDDGSAATTAPSSAPPSSTDTPSGDDSTPAPGDGLDGATLAYSNGHPLNWQTTAAATLSYEEEVLRLVNDHRVSLGRDVLVMDTALRRCARGHSRHMRGDVHLFFAHQNPEGDSPGDRLRRNGISFTAAGENIAAGQTSPAAAFNAWINSPGHRSNIENASWRRTGVGYQPGVSTAGYRHYWTQVFST